MFFRRAYSKLMLGGKLFFLSFLSFFWVVSLIFAYLSSPGSPGSGLSLDSIRQGHRRRQTLSLADPSETAVAGERGAFKSFQPFKTLRRFNVQGSKNSQSSSRSSSSNRSSRRSRSKFKVPGSKFIAIAQFQSFQSFKQIKPSNAFNRCSRVFFPGEAQGLGYFQIRSR